MNAIDLTVQALHDQLGRKRTNDQGFWRYVCQDINELMFMLYRPLQTLHLSTFHLNKTPQCILSTQVQRFPSLRTTFLHLTRHHGCGATPQSAIAKRRGEKHGTRTEIYLVATAAEVWNEVKLPHCDCWKCLE